MLFSQKKIVVNKKWLGHMGSYCIDFTLKTEIKAIISMPEL